MLVEYKVPKPLSVEVSLMPQSIKLQQEKADNAGQIQHLKNIFQDTDKHCCSHCWVTEHRSVKGQTSCMVRNTMK